MLFKRLAVTRMAVVASVITAGVVGSSLVSVATPSPPVAARPVMCPDGTTGVTDGSWTVTCSGVAAAGLTVKLAVNASGSLRVSASVANVTSGSTISYVNVSFVATGGTATLLVSQTGLPNKLVDIAATKTGGGVTTVGATESTVPNLPNVVKMTWH